MSEVGYPEVWEHPHAGQNEFIELVPWGAHRAQYVHEEYNPMIMSRVKRHVFVCVVEEDYLALLPIILLTVHQDVRPDPVLVRRGYC